MNTDQTYKENDEIKDYRVNTKIERMIRNEVLNKFEEVLQATVDKTILSTIPCSNRKDNYAQVKSLFIERYLEPLIRYMSMEEMK